MITIIERRLFMKKLITLFFILSIVFVFNGCARNNDNDLIPGDDNTTDINNPDDISAVPQGVPKATSLNNRNNTGTETPYVTSLRDLDGTLQDSIGELDNMTIDANDKDYFTKQSDYYSRRASAYQKALNSARRLDYTGNTREDHDAIISYYQNGYDTYNKLSSKYKNFRTVEEERAYREGEGRDSYDLAPDITDAYERAVRSLGLR